MIDTIETDVQSPFGEPEVPAAEWTYRFVLGEWARRGPAFFGAAVAKAWERGGYAGSAAGGVPNFPTAMSLERKVGAYVNHGRWLWDCPVCGAAQVASSADPRAFCVGCWNAGDGWWEVEWPAERAAIESLLERRPAESQRSWNLAETVEQLQAENLSIGVDPEVDGHPWVGAQQALELVRQHLELPAGGYVRALTEAAEREGS